MHKYLKNTSGNFKVLIANSKHTYIIISNKGNIVYYLNSIYGVFTYQAIVNITHIVDLWQSLWLSKSCNECSKFGFSRQT